MPTRCNRWIFYCRSYCLLNMFRPPLCPSSGALEYYTSGCCLSYLVLCFQVVGAGWSWGLCVHVFRGNGSEKANLGLARSTELAAIFCKYSAKYLQFSKNGTFLLPQVSTLEQPLHHGETGVSCESRRVCQRWMC
jgi:hypothetical protein